jgi:hypothetical protein
LPHLRKRKKALQRLLVSRLHVLWCDSCAPNEKEFSQRSGRRKVATDFGTLAEIDVKS